jgi:hypothetical protein
MLKRYELHPESNGEGWAIMVIDTDRGFFATVSDFGNYAYLWTSTGCEFRKFLIGLEADYLCKKLLHGRSDSYSIDEVETLNAIMAGIEEHAVAFKEHSNRKWPRYESERDSAKHADFSNDSGFQEWCDNTKLDEPWEYRCTRLNPEAMAFCTKVFPRFTEMLKKELEVEASDLKALEDGRSSIHAAVAKQIADMTDGCEGVGD